MTYDHKKSSVLAYANNFTVWHYIAFHEGKIVTYLFAAGGA
jgi:hypothetical protein